MGISEAIARVRKGAKQARRVLLAGANGRFEDGPLASVGASLGAGLQSDAIPARLRPAASRIASLLGASSEPQRELPSLDARPSGHAHVPSSPHAAQPGTSSDVCPFTGLQADGTVAARSTLGGASVPGASEHVEQSLPESHTAQGAGAADLAPELDVQSQPSAAASSVESSSPAQSSVGKARAAAKEPVAAKRGDGAGKASAARATRSAKSAPAEKAKEKLAGESSVAKTSARSATKPAAKQTNGKANQRKK